MLLVAVGLFAVSALGGLTLAVLHFKKKNLPLSLAMVHGLLGASGLVTLVVLILTGTPSAKVTTAAVLFGAAAIGGFYLFSFHLRKKTLPSPVVIIHALVAVGAFAILLAAAFLGA